MTFRELLVRHRSAECAFDAAVPPAARAASLRAADRALASAAACGADVLVAGEERYPATLLELHDPPTHLFALGAADISPPLVAIVGTRRPTRYGERVTAELATACARAGACVVSGMARGIDSAAHRAALLAGGSTVAVLGTGVDVPYPAANRALHAEIADRGRVLSEHAPGTRALAGSFPRRNRLIAALSSVTIVVEAGTRSGALITAGHALDLGRTVAAVPGPVDSPQSSGTNELLRDGACVIASVADALALVGLTHAPTRPVATLAGDERVVWDALARGPLDVDALTAACRLPARRCLAALTTLELTGTVECALTGEIRRR